MPTNVVRLRPSDDCYSLIKEFESLELIAYPDPGTGAEPWTIGYGTTVYPDGTKVRPGDTCTGEQAQDWLEQDVEKFSEAVNDAVVQPINQAMFDALVSWTYNVGIGAMQKSTLIRLINDGDYIAAAQEFDRWNKANGRIMNGLVRRRDREQALFEHGIDSALNYYAGTLKSGGAA